jgi:hypothetical protein
MVGLDVHIVHNEYHSWDMVQLDDGEWYQVDVYSDAGSTKYRNFNMTDEVARNGHDWDGSALPEAKGTKYSYAVQNAESVKDLYEIPEKVKTAVTDSHSGGLYFKFPDKLTDSDLALADQMLSLVQQAVYMLPTTTSIDLSGAWVPDGEDSYVLAIYYSDYMSDSSLSDAVPEQVTKMTEKVNEVFDTELPDPTTSTTETTAMDMIDSADAGSVTMGDDGNYTVWDEVSADEVPGADGPTATFAAGATN